MLLVIDIVKGIQTQTAEVSLPSSLLCSRSGLIAFRCLPALLCPVGDAALFRDCVLSVLVVCCRAQCLVIGEITSDKLIVVLNKVDALGPDSPERSKAVDKAKAKIAKALAATRFADAPMVRTCPPRPPTCAHRHL